jgi:ADP-dependent NAD(P)H-hydrate dehydratase
MLPADLPPLPARRPDTSKRDYGRVLVVGGSAGMAGAPALSAMAALASGAGLVELLVPESVVVIAASFDPCVMTRGLAAAADGTFAAAASAALRQRIGQADAVAVGPGIGRAADVQELVITAWREIVAPAVFDADALFALAQLPLAERRKHAGPRIITPHAGEMLRLLGEEPGAATAADRPRLECTAAEMAAATDTVVVLKGPGTFVTAGQPGRQARNETGNPGMATAGTGDVLTGVIAALLAQGLEPYAAARLGVWVHGRAGDAAAAAIGQVSLTARDVRDQLHVAFQEIGALAMPSA